MKKRYIIRKFVMADTAKQAIADERKFDVDDVILDEEWEPNQKKPLGFVPKKQ